MTARDRKALHNAIFKAMHEAVATIGFITDEHGNGFFGRFRGPEVQEMCHAAFDEFEKWWKEARR